jgi:hypothetical protein
MRSSTTTPPNQAQQSQVVHDGGQLLIPAGDAAALSCACHDGMAAAWLKTGSLLSPPLPMVTAPLSCSPSSWRMRWSFPRPTPLWALHCSPTSTYLPRSQSSTAKWILYANSHHGSKNRLRPTSDSSQLPTLQSPMCCPLAGNNIFL